MGKRSPLRRASLWLVPRQVLTRSGSLFTQRSARGLAGIGMISLAILACVDSCSSRFSSCYERRACPAGGADEHGSDDFAGSAGAAGESTGEGGAAGEA